MSFVIVRQIVSPWTAGEFQNTLSSRGKLMFSARGFPIRKSTIFQRWHLNACLLIVRRKSAKMLKISGIWRQELLKILLFWLEKSRILDIFSIIWNFLCKHDFSMGGTQKTSVLWLRGFSGTTIRYLTGESLGISRTNYKTLHSFCKQIFGFFWTLTGLKQFYRSDARQKISVQTFCVPTWPTRYAETLFSRKIRK